MTSFMNSPNTKPARHTFQNNFLKMLRISLVFIDQVRNLEYFNVINSRNLGLITNATWELCILSIIIVFSRTPTMFDCAYLKFSVAALKVLRKFFWFVKPAEAMIGRHNSNNIGQRGLLAVVCPRFLSHYLSLFPDL